MRIDDNGGVTREDREARSEIPNLELGHTQRLRPKIWNLSTRVLPETRITVCLQGCSVSTPIPASTAQFNAFRETPRSKDDLSPFGKFYRVVK